ncbi:MAG: SRPBCC family protein [Gordonia sp. (in: high G+C Gram-positive bacteria)]|uniref:SRPBCC family protein n=1 Tax=Gordonia TaxID=2053 RepID=UPI0032635470
MQCTVTTTAPAHAVFDYLADFTNAQFWDPNAVRVIRCGGDGGIGTEYRVTSRFAGRTTELGYRLTDLEPPLLIRLRGEKNSVTAVDTIVIEQTEAAGPETGPPETSVTYAVAFDFHGVLGILEPLLRSAVRRLLVQGADGLRAELQKLR